MYLTDVGLVYEDLVKRSTFAKWGAQTVSGQIRTGFRTEDEAMAWLNDDFARYGSDGPPAWQQQRKKYLEGKCLRCATPLMGAPQCERCGWDANDVPYGLRCTPLP